MYARLLVPLDGSRLAEAVLPMVERLATAWGSTVVLLHVIEHGAPAAVHGDRHLTTVAEAEPYLEELASHLRAEGITVETHAHAVPEGDVARSIAAHGREERSDLIIIATHGRGRVRDILFGRIAQQVLRRGNTPVLLMRPDDSMGQEVGREAQRADPEGTPHRGREAQRAPGHGPHMSTIRTILVPLDGSEAAEAALLPAAAFAEVFAARLHIVMVVPTPETLRSDRLAVSTLLPGATRAALDVEEGDAHRYLQALVKRVQPRIPAISVVQEVCRGDVASVLCAEAREPGVGLIAIATHGHAGLEAVWAGSVTAQLLARARAPILLLRLVDEQGPQLASASAPHNPGGRG